MPPALDRLLASPSALRLLRCIVNGRQVPGAVYCCRHYANEHNAKPKQKWRRWKDAVESIPNRDRVRQLLEAGDPVLPEVEQKALIEGTQPVHEEHELPQIEYTRAASTEHLTAEEKHAALIDGITVGEAADNDAARWASSLFRRERYHGQQGTMAIWKLRQYAASSLPTDDSPHAEYLWGTFIKHPDLVTQVIEHAGEVFKETGKVHPRLYELLMSYWLPRSNIRALEYHRLMLDKLHLKKLPLTKLARYGASTFKPLAYDALLEIYWASEERDLYNDVVPVLVDKGNIAMARKWHTACTQRGDMPFEAVADHAVVQMFMAETAAAEKDETVSKDDIREDRKYDKTLMRRLRGRETPPVRFDDAFTARMFATRTFPTDTVIRGLAMVGVNEMGPQAVLAMALRTDPLEDLPRMFEELRASGIALQGCVYSLAIEKFATTQKWQLVRSMLDSDQHPDVFGDADVQRKLLDFYLDQNDHVQVQRTLAILTLFHNQSSQESWNILLQMHIKRTGSQHVTEVLQNMRARGVMVSTESIIAVKSLLRRRQRGHKPAIVRNPYDDLRFVTRVYTTILEFGMGTVSPLSWREIIRRFGMTGRFKELRRLLLWLLCWYAPRSSTQFTNLPASPFRRVAWENLRKTFPEGGQYFHFPASITQHKSIHHPIRRLFPPSLQQGLIVWGFRAGLLPHANLEQSLFGSILAKRHYRRRLLQRQILQRKRWTIGLRTLVLLRDLGLYVHPHTVVKALQMQFTNMFGRGRSNKIDNRIIEDTNSLSYSAYVRKVNEIWGSSLFREPSSFHKGMVHDRIWHPRRRRVAERKRSISIKDILGRDWQTLLNSDSSDSVVPTTRPEEDAAYQNLKRTFEAQEQAPEPGFEWMYEKDLRTTQEDDKKAGRTRRVVRNVRAKPWEREQEK